MKKLTRIHQFLVLLASTTIALISQTNFVEASTLYDGWSYTNDPKYDGLASNNSQIFDIGGTAIKVDNSNVYVAINGNLPLSGAYTGPYYAGYPISNGNIGWGDLFFDFSGKGSLLNASNSASLFGVRFASNNDSKVAGTGVFAAVTGIGVEKQNAGYWNLGWGSYSGTVVSRTGLAPVVGDLAWYDPYLAVPSSSLVPNVINTGAKIGDITMLNSSDLASAGYIGNAFGLTDSQTFGFKFDRNLLPNGAFVSSLFLECLNDSVASVGYKEPPRQAPVPSLLLGILLSGSFGTWNIVKKRARASQVST
jgi:hypothetical protein